VKYFFSYLLLTLATGLTESTAVISHTSTSDVLYGSCGSLLPGYEARLIAPDGTEIHEYDQPGELVVKGPTIVLGYLNNEAATKETFTDDGWLRTGDEAVIRKSEKGYEHIFVVDRIKELIKVKVRPDPCSMLNMANLQRFH
jgi:long-subunit acyl-CoA synthetase (AMP-forming)